MSVGWHHVRLAPGVGLVIGLDDVGIARDTRPAVRAAREAIAQAAGMAWSSVAVVGAVHGAAVGCADSVQGLVEGVDGLVVGRPGAGLFAVFADCVPLVLWGPGPVIALGHAGWRGTAAGVAAALVGDLRRRYGVRSGDLSARLGPAICGNCYEVGPEVAGRFPPTAVSGRPGGPHLDLVEANRVALEELGLTPRLIAVDSRCTMESPEFPSHRRSADGRRFGVLVRIADRLAEAGAGG